MDPLFAFTQHGLCDRVWITLDVDTFLKFNGKSRLHQSLNEEERFSTQWPTPNLR
jgi:hypothetical protein